MSDTITTAPAPSGTVTPKPATLILDRLVDGILAPSEGTRSLQQELALALEEISTQLRLGGNAAKSLKAEMRTRAENLLRLKAVAALKRAAGEPTDIEDASIASSVASLRSAGAIAAVTIVDRVLQAVFTRTIGAVFTVL